MFLTGLYVSFVVVASTVTLLKLVHEYRKEKVR
jgi:hypothetical protein